jgi:hypothetical protein
MNKRSRFLLYLLPLCFLLPSLLLSPVAPAVAQETAPPPSPTATQPPATYERPLIVVESYNASVSSIKFGQDLDVEIVLYNAGQNYATNIVLSFTPGDLYPRGTGGLLAVDEIAPGNHAYLTQPLTADSDLWGKSVVTMDVSISYYDQQGILYTEKVVLTFPVTPPQIGPAPTGTPTLTLTPTATAVPLRRPQLVITSYQSDVTPLEPGSQFTLQLEIQNLGNAAAQRVTMIVGGGSASASGGTPEPGGISGSSGEFTNFAPLGSSNIQSLGDLGVGESLSASQTLIVNVSTNPGAYPMKISFVYLDEGEHSVTDDQVITLLVYSQPKVDISFYRDPGQLFADQPNALPLQIVNLGRKTAVLGNMRVTADGKMFENNTILVGSLESGGYFTLDATVYPDQPGPLDLLVTVDYTDDFNQSRIISRTLTIEVMDAPIIEPPIDESPGEGEPGGEPIQESETIWQSLWRFILGMLGLDSSRPTAGDGLPGPEGDLTPEGEKPPVGPPLKMP